MSVFVPLALFGWPLVVLVLFALMSPQRAVAWAFVGAWLFLPMAGYPIPGLPDYTKTSAATYAAVLGLLLFHPQLLLGIKLRWWDVPAAVMCVAPMVSSLTNGLGPYDGASATVSSFVGVGLPYLCGRAAFRTMEQARELVLVIVWGGLLYVPFCLYEVRMSPQLHTMFYGFMQHSFAMTVRGGGWRPMVFMQHGLAVGLWMAVASVAAFWMWRMKSLPLAFGMKGGWQVLALVTTTVLCKSTGATALMLAVIATLELGRHGGRRWVLLALLLAAPVFLTGRIAGVWDGRFWVEQANENLSAQRAQSLEFRLDNEDLLMAKALQRPVFGWGGWGRNRVFNDEGRDLTITDGYWIIIMGVNGMVGLAAFYAMLVGPGLLWVSRNGSLIWTAAGAAPVVLCCVSAIYAIDCIPNAMPNPVFLLASAAMAGVLGTGVAIAQPNARLRRNPRQAPTTKPGNVASGVQS